MGKPLNVASLVEKMGMELAEAKNAKDSLRLLYDIYDISDRSEQKRYAWKIYDVTRRLNDTDGTANILCQMVGLNFKNDTVLAQLAQLAKELPDGEAKKGAQLFINVQRASSRSWYLKEADRVKRIKDMMMKEEAPEAEADIYKEIEQLYTLCLYIGSTTKSDLFMEYFEKLGRRVDKLPKEIYSIRNLYYTTAANFYSNNDEPQKAVEADRKLLQVMEELDEKYAKEGRGYRNYDTYQWISYRRMLSNYEALTLEEAEAIYAKALELTRVNHDVKENYADQHRIDIYIAMKRGQYGVAVPMIKDWLAKHDKPVLRRQMLKMLVTGAEAIGDKESQLAALKEYNTILEDYNRLHSAEAYREMQIRYDVTDLKTKNMKLELARRDEQVAFDQKIILITLVASFILIVVLLFLARSYGDVKHQLTELKNDNFLLKDENTRLSHMRERLKADLDEARKPRKNVGSPEGYMPPQQQYETVGEESGQRRRDI